MNIINGIVQVQFNVVISQIFSALNFRNHL